MKQENPHRSDILVARGLVYLISLTLGEDFPPETPARVSLFLRLVREIDSEIDGLDKPQKRQHQGELFSEYLKSEPGSPPHANDDKARFRQHLRSLPDQKQNFFFSEFSRLLQTTEQLRTAPDINTYSQLTKEEADLTASLLLTFLNLPLESPSDKMFEKLVKDLARSRNFLDNSLDLPQDYANRETLVDPSLENSIRLALEGAGQLPGALIQLLAIGASKLSPSP